MKMFTESGADLLRVRLIGEIDHHNAAEVRTGIDALLISEKPKTFYFHLSGVTFCDSSGLGLVMGRMRTCSLQGTTLIVEEPSDAVWKILHIAGMDKLLQIERGENRHEKVC